MTRSFSELYQADIPQAHIIKAFNTMAMELYNHSTQTLQEANALCLIADDNAEAKDKVARLAQIGGLVPQDTGFLSQARLLESFADLIRVLMIQQRMGPFLTFSATILSAPVENCLGTRQLSNFK